MSFVSPNVSQRLFQYLKTVRPPADLERAIQTRIHLLIRCRLALSSVVSLAALGGIIWSLALVNSNVVETGLYHYLSLFLSDSDIILADWREFTLSLIESAPLVATTAFFGLAALFLWIVPRAIDDAHLAYGF